MNFYKRHIGDYLKDTAHLSLLEHGIYTRLLDVYYTRETGVHKDEAARLISARSKEERSALTAVLDEFFDVDESGVYTQGRCEREIAVAQESASRSRSVGKLGGRPRKSKTCEVLEKNPEGSKTEPTDNPSHKPLASNQKEKREKKSASRPLPDDFGISDRVTTWAVGKGYGHLDAQLEALVSYARRKGARYVDWDEALMTAIREDWARVGAKTNGADVFAGAR